jgi:signal transduction histidine kinase
MVDLETALTAYPDAVQLLQPYLKRLRIGLEHAMDEVSRIVLDLRPAMLEDHGLVAALRWYGTERLRDSDINFHVNAACAPRLPDHLETTVYRIAQEAITNVVRHAAARNLWLEVACPDHSFTLTVRDDGCGFDVETILAQPTGMQGIGLLGMKERAALVGGELTIESAPGQGTSVQITLPRKGQAGHGQNQNPVGR